MVWTRTVWGLFAELPKAEQEAMFDHLKYLTRFPHRSPVRSKGRVRRHRWFQAGNCLVYDRVVDKTVYIRWIWPAGIP